MPSTQAVVNNHEYRNIPIATLVESPTNPRKRFDERTLRELAASFKTQGVLEPLLVRPSKKASTRWSSAHAG
jgi:ParB family chromosome partitioning protein